MMKLVFLIVCCVGSLVPGDALENNENPYYNTQQQTYAPTYTPNRVPVYPTTSPTTSPTYAPTVVPTYPTPSAYPVGQGNYQYAPGPFYRILRQENEVFPDGKYHYLYETENGIFAEETGELRGTGDQAGTAARGSYQYTSPEGLLIQVQYVADENGFYPKTNIVKSSGSRPLS